MQGQVFQKAGVEVVPDYLHEDFPDKLKAPTKYGYIFKLGNKGVQWKGERPPVEKYNNIVRGIYNEHLKTHSQYG
jgi:hypothetical protein